MKMKEKGKDGMKQKKDEKRVIKEEYRVCVICRY